MRIYTGLLARIRIEDVVVTILHEFWLTPAAPSCNENLARWVTEGSAAIGQRRARLGEFTKVS